MNNINNKRFSKINNSNKIGVIDSTNCECETSIGVHEIDACMVKYTLVIKKSCDKFCWSMAHFHHYIIPKIYSETSE